MNIPFVIDNQQHKMSDVLNALLAHHSGHSLDIATANFNEQTLRLVEYLIAFLRQEHVQV